AESKPIENGNAHADADCSIPTRYEVIGKAPAKTVRAHGSTSRNTEGADYRKELISLGAAKLLGSFLLIRKRLQIGTLLKRGADEPINVGGRCRSLRVLFTECKRHLVIEAKNGGQSRHARVEIVLGVELKQLCLGKIDLRERQVEIRLQIVLCQFVDLMFN